MARTYTSPTEATIIAAVWQIDDWCDANRADGVATIDGFATVTAHVQAVVSACLAMDPQPIVDTVDRLVAVLADPTVDVGLTSSDVDGFTLMLRELLHELTW